MNKQESCPECHGKGWIELHCSSPEVARTCGLCNGAGMTPSGKECKGCRGTGRIEVRTVEQQKCLHCAGTGKYPVPEAL
jgi:DnaJ-class molecular chaperone